MGRMVVRGVKIMMQTLRHGNNDGYSMVEAAVSIFIAGTLLLVILGFMIVSQRYTNKVIRQTELLIKMENDYSLQQIKNKK